MPRKSSRSYTLLEVILAFILFCIITMAVTASIHMMYDSVGSFNNLTQTNLRFYDFTRQISEDMHNASYAEIDATGGIVTFYDYNDLVLSVYSNQPEGIEYTPPGSASPQSIERFRGVNATFAEMRSHSTINRITEIRVNVTKPFVSSIYLRHGISVKADNETGGNKWTLRINSTKGIKLMSVVLSLDTSGHADGYVAAGYANITTGKCDAFIVKTNKDGSVLWQKVFYTSGINVSKFYDVRQTVNASHQPDGYIAVGSTGNAVTVNSKTYWRYGFYVVRFNMNGSVAWSRRYDYGAAGANNKEEAYCVRQVFDSTGSPDGYVMLGHLDTPTAANDILLVRIADNASVSWAKRMAMAGDEGEIAGTLEVTVDDSHVINGFIFSIDGHLDIGKSSGRQPLAVVRTNTTGDTVVWSILISNSRSDNNSPISQVFRPDGTTDGYILGGAWSNIDDPYLARLDNNGNITPWSAFYRSVSAYCFTDVFQIYDKYGNPWGFTALLYEAPGQGGNIVRINEDGTIKWTGDVFSGAGWCSMRPSFDSTGKPDGYIATTAKTSPVLIVKTDRRGVTGTQTTVNLTGTRTALSPANVNFSGNTTAVPLVPTVLSDNPTQL